MSLGKKITVLVLLLGCCIAAGCYIAISYTVFPAFEEFEQEAAREAVDRIDHVAGAEARAFAVMNSEYARWDDTYAFARSRDPGYIRQNLDPGYWKNTLDVDLVLILNVDGELIWGAQTAPGSPSVTSVADGLGQSLEPTHPLLQHKAERDGVSGIMRTPQGPMLVTSDAILMTYDQGPSGGSFIIGRFIDSSLIADLSNRSAVDAEFLPVTADGAGELTADQVAAIDASDNRYQVTRTDADIVAHRVYRDMQGAPAGVVKVVMPQTITRLGRDVITSAVLLIACIMAVFLVVAVVLMRRLVVAPVDTLSAQMQRMRESGDLVADIDMSRNDELGSLSREFSALTMELHFAQKELEATRDVAVEASHAKSDFLARMSHEIRTPMNGVLGMTELLRNTQLSFEQRRFADTIYSSAESLLDIINDILDFSKIEAGKLQLELHDIDVGAVVEETVEALAPQAHKKGLELINDVAPEVHTSLRADPVRIRQVLTNLIANAIKFTEHGEVVSRVSVENETPEAVSLRFEVVDTGIGIRAEKQKVIFDSFAQEDGSTTRLYGGTGLGLAISKQLVDLMHGDLEVTSESGAGSTFAFTLTLDRGSEDVEASELPGGRVAGARILVVDDNATNREILEQQLQGWRARCDSAGSADDAMHFLARSLRNERHYDLVVLDMHMPRVDGIELAGRIRAEEAFDDVKLLLLSSIALPAEEPILQELGISGQLTKPIRQGRLYDCLSVVLTGDALASSYSRHSRTATRILTGRVLLAEDNPVNQAVALGMLDSIGVEVVVVADGEAAVRAATEQPFDLVLMDCQMPVKDGLEATADIRRDEAQTCREAIPIVALTANAMAGDREQCLAAGMDDHLGKPFTKDQLHAVLSLYLQRPAYEAREPSSGKTAPQAVGNAVDPTEDAPLDPAVLAVLRNLQKPGAPCLVDKVIGIYLDSAPACKDRLVSGARKQDVAEVRESAHALKSSSTNVGATRLSDLCRQLEHMARDGDLGAAPAMVHDLDAEFGRVIDALQAERREVTQ